MTRVGVDTGGTFTDVVAVDGAGRLWVAKVASTPRDPAQAVLDGVRQSAAAGAIAELVHSTTVATNALLERSGGPTALVTTRGFEDVLELGRQARPRLYALHPTVVPALVPPTHRLGLEERMLHDGSVLVAPSPEALAELVERVRVLVLSEGVRSVAVCLLHAYANPAHEQAVARTLAPLGLPLSLSSDVLPAPREYERTSTTVIDAHVRPVMAAYLGRLTGVATRLRVMQSNGGALSAEEAARRPVSTLLSGPAAGVVGALAVAARAGVTDLLTLDMGGTSTDVALVLDGRIGRVDEAEVGGCVLQLPMLAVHTVGAGGGSIAALDPGGALKVGPRSAGADPGPAAYARGGTLPTVTDAHLVLGRLDPARFLGGAMRLSPAAARAALQPLAAQLGVSVERMAEDVVAVADAVMARALRRISVERGIDPALLVLMPFGGAGPLHGCAIARELGMPRVLVPPSPGLLCAYGALAADIAREWVHTQLTLLDARFDAAALETRFAALEADAGAWLDAEDVQAERRALERALTLRYRGQSFELEVGWTRDPAAAFHAAHRACYGYALDEPVELVTLRLRAVGRVASPPPPVEPAEPGASEVGRTRLCVGGVVVDAPVYARRRLVAGARIDGPALIVEHSASTFLPADAQAHALEGGILQITLQSA